MSSTIAVVGAPLDDSACPSSSGCNSGAVSVLERNEGGTNSWGRTTTLTAADASAGDIFGLSVALDGTTALIGAPDAAGAIPAPAPRISSSKTTAAPTAGDSWPS